VAARARRGDKPASPSQVVSEVKQAFQAWKDVTTQAQLLDQIARGKGPRPVLPAEQQSANSREYEDLQAMSPSPWGYVICEQMTQALFVEGHRPSQQNPDLAVDEEEGNSPAWDQLWQPNQMDSQQVPIYHGAFETGASYVLALPGRDPLTGEPRTVFKGKSSKRMVAFYDDDFDDDFPSFAIEGVPQKTEKGDPGFALRYYDDTHWHTLSTDEDGDAIEYTGESTPHNAGRPPIVRYANRPDLEGGYLSEIEPLIPVLGRIDQDVFDRLVVQRFGAWVIRWVSGLKKPATPAETAEYELALKVSHLLVSEDPNTKFGTMAASSLDGYILAREHDMRDLAAISQVPPHWLTGAMVNLSAEALAAAEAAYMRKIDLCKHTFGEKHELLLRLGAKMSNLPGVTDFGAEVQWKDTESRSLVQAATALGILTKQLQIPPELLWGRIPGWTAQMTKRAKGIMADGEWVRLMAGMGLNADGSVVAPTPAPAAAGPKPPIRVS
jgi:hypothetical protein